MEEITKEFALEVIEGMGLTEDRVPEFCTSVVYMRDDCHSTLISLFKSRKATDAYEDRIAFAGLAGRLGVSGGSKAIEDIYGAAVEANKKVREAIDGLLPTHTRLEETILMMLSVVTALELDVPALYGEGGMDI